MSLFSQRLDKNTTTPSVVKTLYLTAEERTRSNYRFDTPEGEPIFLRLPRGTVLQDGDILRDETGELLKIAAKAEPVLTVTADNGVNLMRAAYHLGNRHIPLEVKANYLRLSVDSVLQKMLEQMQVNVCEEVVPFYPEVGAYGQHHH